MVFLSLRLGRFKIFMLIFALLFTQASIADEGAIPCDASTGCSQSVFTSGAAPSTETTIVVQDWGNASQSCAILMLHGLIHSHLNWIKQITDPNLRAKCRIVTMDTRGHGASGKPADIAAYSSANFAADVAKVIDELNLESHNKFIVVSHSYGTLVLNDYLTSLLPSGPSAIPFDGIVYEGGIYIFVPPINDPTPPGFVSQGITPAFFALDVGSRILGTNVFIQSLFNGELPLSLKNTMLAYDMIVEPAIRGNILGRVNPFGPLGFSGPPAPANVIMPFISGKKVMIAHGEKDVVFAKETAALAASLSGAQLVLYPGSGHTPHLELSEPYNNQLLNFINSLP